MGDPSRTAPSTRDVFRRGGGEIGSRWTVVKRLIRRLDAAVRHHTPSASSCWIFLQGLRNAECTRMHLRHTVVRGFMYTLFHVRCVFLHFRTVLRPPRLEAGKGIWY